MKTQSFYRHPAVFVAVSATVVIGVISAGSDAHAQRSKIPAPVHPDTLPTLIRSWSLPASLSSRVENSYAPRISQAEGTLYIFDHHGRRLAAVSAKNGKVLWHRPVAARSDRAFAFTPLVHRGSVYVATDGYLRAFTQKDGKTRWDVKLKGTAVNGVARAKHRLILPWVQIRAGQTQSPVHVWGIDSRNGRVEWSKKYPGSMAHIAGNADGAYYVGDTGVVLGLTPDRGDPTWQLRVKGRVLQAPLLKGNQLFVTSVRRKSGVTSTGLYCIDVRKGRLLWESKLPSGRVARFLSGERLVTVEDSGRFRVYDAKGKPAIEVSLGFGEPPTTLAGASSDDRAYVFSRDPGGEGFVWLIDLARKRVLATANALDQNVQSMIATGKTILLDGSGGDVYAYRLDRSQRPTRRTVPADEFAKQLLSRARQSSRSIPGLSRKLAGLGAKAAPVMEKALAEDNAHVVIPAAEALGMLRSRRSAGALVTALNRLSGSRVATPDPVQVVVSALAQLRDPRAIKPLQQLMTDVGQAHPRRRAAYVALGAIGTPPALAPIWAFRAAKSVPSGPWQPEALTLSEAYRVEVDYIANGRASKPGTAITIRGHDAQPYTVSLSGYLGGYNDVWISRGDSPATLTEPLFTGLTKAEISPGRRLKFKQGTLSKNGLLTLVVAYRNRGQWVNARPVKLKLKQLRKDRDQDGLPDAVEQRLQTCVHHPDCDGDGLRDSEDLNPLASGKIKPGPDQQLFREAFFAYFAFLNRRGIVVVDPGKRPSIEYYGRRDPVLSLRQPAMENLRKQAGLHAVDFVSFGGPYPAGSSSGDALPKVVYKRGGRVAQVGMDVVRAGNNAVAYNITLRKVGKNWVITEMARAWRAD